MNRSKLYSVVFVLIITVFWGFALSFAATSLRAPQQANELLNVRTTSWSRSGWWSATRSLMLTR